MATYKLIQDIEAEDKILGPLTLRQFIFALIAVFLFYICFILIVKNVAFMLVIFLPPALFFGFFALPFGRDQPTEIWALAKLRFWFKPRVRIWDQSGVKELVTVMAPKKVERVLTDGLSQYEVKSRLKALASTIDSRGWAIKDADYVVPTSLSGSSERLMDLGSLPTSVPDAEILASDDMLDTRNNPIAKQFDAMISKSSSNRRQQLVDWLNTTRSDEMPVTPSTPKQANQEAIMSLAENNDLNVSTLAREAKRDNWFLPGEELSAATQVQNDGFGDTSDAIYSEEEARLLEELKSKESARDMSYSNLRTMQPLSTPSTPAVSTADIPPTPTANNTGVASSVSAAEPAILSLAENNDLNVSTLAREAKRSKGDEDVLNSDKEVVISLH